MINDRMIVGLIMAGFVISSGFLIYAVKDLSSSGIACTSNPFVYGARYQAGEDGRMSCNCQVIRDGKIGRYYFDNHGRDSPI